MNLTTKLSDARGALREAGWSDEDVLAVIPLEQSAALIPSLGKSHAEGVESKETSPSCARLKGEGEAPSKDSASGVNTRSVETATLRGQTNLPLNLRERDLLRYCRGELHVAGLVTDDEYAEMLGWSSAKAGGGSHAARRLEDYDELRAEIDRLHEGVELIAAFDPDDNVDELRKIATDLLARSVPQ